MSASLVPGRELFSIRSAWGLLVAADWDNPRAGGRVELRPDSSAEIMTLPDIDTAG